MSETLFVGDVRPSQIMYTYGVGSIVDLPNLSVIVMGLDDWKPGESLTENRLLHAVQHHLPSARKLNRLPQDTQTPDSPLDLSAMNGIPVATFPRWWVCPVCRVLAPLSSGLFKLKEDPYHPDHTRYVHESCEKARTSKPQAVPARILVACEEGHLDDFPWEAFAHRGEPCTFAKPLLRLLEYEVTGEARDLEVRCECGASRRLAEAFGRDNRERMPRCTSRRPHLRDYDPTPCRHKARPIVLGATNLWFPINLSALSIPRAKDTLLREVEANWEVLQNASTVDVVKAFRAIGKLQGEIADFSDEQILEAVRDYGGHIADPLAKNDEVPDLYLPEWEVLSEADPALNGPEFRTRRLTLSPELRQLHLTDVVLVERLREVQATVGFARLDSVGELTDPTQQILVQKAPLARTAPAWVPACDQRGEGIFLRIDEEAIAAWADLSGPAALRDSFHVAHTNWRRKRGIAAPEDGFPGMRYVLLHSFAHAIMRQIALDAGYSAASLKERIYARPPGVPGGPMAGVLVYTAASDSEGTLGGLIGLGEDDGALNRLLRTALESIRLCAGDPLCAEHEVDATGRTVHGAACHGCLFAPETSCERGNRYLDRRVLIPTVRGEETDTVFFREADR